MSYPEKYIGSEKVYDIDGLLVAGYRLQELKSAVEIVATVVSVSLFALSYTMMSI